MRTETLNNLKIGESAVVESLHAVGTMRRRLSDIGLAPQAEVTCVGRAPCGDPIAFEIRGTVMALRVDDCRRVSVRRCE